MKTFVIGDIHGAHKALLQCLERSKFDYDNDRLIVLGDVCDGWPEVRQSIDELLKISHCDYILGNHDLWALEWALTGKREEIWTSQGGDNTLASYNHKDMPQSHIDLLKNANLYIELENRLFVHGGFDPYKPIARQGKDILLWDRTLIYSAATRHFQNPANRMTSYEEVFVGHTPTTNFHSLLPIKFCEIWDLDTGAGWNGKLTIMDLATKKFWQSDLVPTLYPNEPGRGR